MKFIDPSFEILTDVSDGGIKELKHIERCVRVSQRQNQAVINPLDARNWYDTPCYEVERSVKVTDNIIETETSLIPHDIKCESSCINKKKSIFDGMFDFLEELVSELNGIIAYVLGDY